MITIEHVDTAIIVALAIEAAPLCARVEEPVRLRASGRRVTVGRLGDGSVAIIEAGVGRQAAETAARLVIDGHRPRRVIAAGLCGGLAPSLARGSIVIAARVGTPQRGETRPVEPLHIDADAAVGPLVTADAVVASAVAKRSLHEATGAIAVDMESWWVAAVADGAGLPCHVIRAVSDTATDGIAADVASLAAIAHPARQAGAAVRLAWRRPAAIAELAELREHAHRASEALAESLRAALLRVR